MDFFSDKTQRQSLVVAEVWEHSYIFLSLMQISGWMIFETCHAKWALFWARNGLFSDKTQRQSLVVAEVWELWPEKWPKLCSFSSSQISSMSAMPTSGVGLRNKWSTDTSGVPVRFGLPSSPAWWPLELVVLERSAADKNIEPWPKIILCVTITTTSKYLW